MVVVAELVATGGGCCPFSSTVQRHTGLFLFFPLPCLFSVSSLLVLLFSFFFFSLLFPSSVLPCLSSNSQNAPLLFFRLCLCLIYLPKTIPPLKRPQRLLFTLFCFVLFAARLSSPFSKTKYGENERRSNQLWRDHGSNSCCQLCWGILATKFGT